MIIHAFIRKILSQLFDYKEYKKAPILYGGSVNLSNANELISIDSVNGFLIGGASLDVIKFSNIIKIVNSQ
jgi:Triosephosphate isomerase